MKVLKMMFVISLIALSGCANNIEIKQVDCTGHMYEGLDNRHYSSKLIKYAPESKRFFSAGESSLGLRGWIRMDAFDKITCTKGKGIDD